MSDIIKLLENRAFLMDNELIENLSKNDESLLRVMKGRADQSFGLTPLKEPLDNFEFILYYVKRKKELVEGIVLKLTPHLKLRNDLVAAFSSLIVKKFKTENVVAIFNTFQELQTTFFEKLNYWVFSRCWHPCQQQTCSS